jgi:molecular chaperone HtpG
MTYRFQVNLGGIIDLLSNHTYSSPEVYIRELLQNGVDAVVARSRLEPDYRGEMTIEVSLQVNQADHSLVFRDNGIGLTEAEIHLFLATIGGEFKT